MLRFRRSSSHKCCRRTSCLNIATLRCHRRWIALADHANRVPAMASLAAVLILAMRAMPAWLIRSPSWLMMNRTACLSGEGHFQAAALEVRDYPKTSGRQIERVVVARSIKGFAHRPRILLHRGHLILQPFLGGMRSTSRIAFMLFMVWIISGHHRGQLGHGRVRRCARRQQVVVDVGHDVDSAEGTIEHRPQRDQQTGMSWQCFSQ